MCNHSPNKVRALYLEELPWAASQPNGKVPYCRPAAPRRDDSSGPQVGLHLHPSLISSVVKYSHSSPHKLKVLSSTWQQWKSGLHRMSTSAVIICYSSVVGRFRSLPHVTTQIWAYLISKYNGKCVVLSEYKPMHDHKRSCCCFLG